jgi:hypothetical protein
MAQQWWALFGQTAYQGANSVLPAYPVALLLDVLRDLLVRPSTLLRRWNWKSAALSMILRGPIFLIASMRRGWEVTAAALLTEDGGDSQFLTTTG